MSGRQSIKVYMSACHSEVTGSKIPLTIVFPNNRKQRILIDCGSFQEKDYRYLNYFTDVNPKNVDAILITHNHIDHTGQLPTMVKGGFKSFIYMTKITRQLLPAFLMDSASRQTKNMKEMIAMYPEEAWRFKPLYNKDDVRETLKHCVGVRYQETMEILPGIEVTFFINGHILGAAMILIQCHYPGVRPLNLLFTGDYKLQNPFFEVPDLPEWLKKMNLIVIHEATYGTTKAECLKVCFVKNLLEAFKKQQDILIGASAQGKMQDVLLDLRKLQNMNLIPENYDICIDGTLGISTTYAYQEILEEFNPKKTDFIPDGIIKVDWKQRKTILNSNRRKIIVTTSGMLSNGPAQVYVPIFLQHKKALIHLTGYAAEDTLARKLIDAKHEEVVVIDNKVYQKRADIKSTREKTAHTTLDESLKFIGKFEHIAFLAINHGREEVKLGFKDIVDEQCSNVEQTGILDRETVFCITQSGKSSEKTDRIEVIEKKKKAGCVKKQNKS